MGSNFAGMIIGFIFGLITAIPIMWYCIKITKSDSEKLLSYFKFNKLVPERPNFQISWLNKVYNKIIESRIGILKCISRCSSASIEVAIASAKFSHFIDGLSKQVNEQRQRASTISAAAEELSVNTNQIAKSASEATDSSEKTKLVCEQGIQKLNTISSGIVDLKDTVMDTTNRMVELNEYVTQVQGITDVINGVAEQTNLLALNAAIEAARAGDQGRGFAVVADEVRELANKSSSYTHEIDEKLNGMVKLSRQTTEEITNFRQMVEIVVDQIEEIGHEIKHINHEAINSDTKISDISRIMNQHSEAVSQIAQEVDNLRLSFDSIGSNAENMSSDALGLSERAELIYEINADYEFDSIHDKVKQLAQSAAEKCAHVFEEALENGRLTEKDLFDQEYLAIEGTCPQKYSTRYDKFTDEVLPPIQEPILKEMTSIILAGAVDVNGYFPTHNKRFSKPLTGDYDTDLANNRTKRIFNDRTGARCGSNTKSFLLQTYKRDTGEILHDISAPIFVNGKHWGGFRIGYGSEQPSE